MNNNYWLLGIVPCRGGKKAGTGAVKYCGASKKGKMMCSKHLMILSN